MRTIVLAGSTSLIANFLVLSTNVPLAIGFRLVVIVQIAFWTFFAATGATVTMTVLKKLVLNPTRPFILLAFLVFLVSLIPIYLRVGILHDFSPGLVVTVVYSLVAMHITDSLLISGFVLGLNRSRNSPLFG